MPDPGLIDHRVPESALTSFSEALSKELSPPDVRVNAISPGPVSTATRPDVPSGIGARMAELSWQRARRS